MLVFGESFWGSAIISTLGLIPYRYMRFNTFLINHPAEDFSGSICGVTNQTLWFYLKSRFNSINHRLGRVHFFPAIRCRRFNINDDADIQINQVVCRIGKKGWTTRCCSPTGRRIRDRYTLCRFLTVIQWKESSEM